MFSKELIILNQQGFHARPAQLFVETANKFQSQIKVRKEDGTEADGKSILGLMTLELAKGKKIVIEAEGPDEKAAVAALDQLIESKFGEE